MGTSELVDALNGDDELPYGAWRDGKGIDGRAVARLLKPYGVKPRTVRLGDGTVKGYARDADLEDAFARYLLTEASQASPPDQATNGHVPDVTHVTVLAETGDGHGLVAVEDPDEARAERMRADYLADVEHSARCRCDRPLLIPDDDGDPACGRCGRPAP